MTALIYINITNISKKYIAVYFSVEQSMPYAVFTDEYNAHLYIFN